MKIKRKIAVFLTVCILMSVLSWVMGIGGVSVSAAYPDPNGKYITLTGAGSKNGTSWENAWGFNTTTLRTAWDNTPSNGTLYVGSGTYTGSGAAVYCNANKGGQSAASPKKLLGVDRGGGKPVFVGDFTPTSGTTPKFFDMVAGVNHVIFENLRIQNYYYGIRTAGNATNITIKDVDVYVSNDAIYLNGGGTTGDSLKLSNVTVDNCKFYYYTKSGIRTVNRVEDVLVSNCYADAGGQAYFYPDNWPVGFRLTGDTAGVAERRITFVDCITKGNYEENGTEYWNADGFSAERESYDINYIRCKAYGATDGGWDIKTYNAALTDCIAMDNKRNFRVWSSGQTTMTNCLAAYSYKRGGSSSSVGMWASGKVVANFCTFYNNAGAQVESSSGTIALNDCIVGANIAGKSLYAGSGITATRTATYLAGGSGTDPQINVSDNSYFYGDTGKYNSGLYKDTKGYYVSNKTTVLKEDFESYSSSSTLQSGGGWTHTSGISNVTLGTNSTKYGIVRSGAANAYGAKAFTMAVPLNATGGASPGRNARLIAEFRVARGSFNGGNGSWATFTDSSITTNSTSYTGALSVGSRMQSASPFDTALYRYSTNLTSVPAGSVLLAGTNDSAATGTWVKVKYVVSITNASGAYLAAPKVDIYVNGGATPVVSNADLLKPANKIDCLRLSSSSSTGIMWVDDINVYLETVPA